MNDGMVGQGQLTVEMMDSEIDQELEKWTGERMYRRMNE